MMVIRKMIIWTSTSTDAYNALHTVYCTVCTCCRMTTCTTSDSNLLVCGGTSNTATVLIAFMKKTCKCEYITSAMYHGSIRCGGWG